MVWYMTVIVYMGTLSPPITEHFPIGTFEQCQEVVKASKVSDQRQITVFCSKGEQK